MNDKIEKIIALKNINTENISFNLIRHYAKRDNGIKDNLNYGRAILDSEDELDQYLYTYGLMIKSQWETLLSSVKPFAKDSNISIIDYACGQGLASMLFLDKFKNEYSEKISQITLIEPSLIALKRANSILNCYCPDSKIKIINKKIDDLTMVDLKLSETDTKIHLFSNILDINNFNQFYLFDKIFLNKGTHFILAVSPDRSFNGGSPRLQDLYKSINDKKYSNWPTVIHSEIHQFQTSNKQPALCFLVHIINMKIDLFNENNEKTLPFEVPIEDGYSARWNEKLNGFLIKVPNGELFFSENFFDKKISDRSVEYFQENDTLDWRETNWNEISDEDLIKINFENIKWKHDNINMYGKIIPLPRLTSWYGDQGKSYMYSGIKSEPNPWNKGLSYIKEQIETVTDTKFNSVLLNWYRNGDDHLNWHTDNEKELGKNPVIASVNFGETRDFVIRKNDDKSKKITIPLQHGTLIIMRGELQHFWQHSVPKRIKVKSSRFNLTFRVIVS